MVQNNSIWTTKSGYKIGCPKCKKEYVKWAVPRIKRYLHDRPSTPISRIAKDYGIPRVTLIRRLKK